MTKWRPISSYLKEVLTEVVAKSIISVKYWLKKRKNIIETIAPSYTLLQHAQPISFGHHLMAYYQMLTRDEQRFTENMQRADISPLGAAL